MRTTTLLILKLQLCGCKYGVKICTTEVKLELKGLLHATPQVSLGDLELVDTCLGLLCVSSCIDLLVHRVSDIPIVVRRKTCPNVKNKSDDKNVAPISKKTIASAKTLLS